MAEAAFESWQCASCGFVYSEADGDPLDGISPGTRWADLPPDWVCPMCGNPKSDFQRLET